MSIAHTFKDKKRTADVLISEVVDFSGLLLSTPVLNGLTEAGFQKPSPIQLKAIPLGRCGLDLIVQAKSGTGKTCVFTVVALESVDISAVCVQVLVLAPTREIASQIQEVVRTVGALMTGLKCHTFIGGLPVLQDKILAKNCHIAVGTPGRVKQLIEMGALKTNSIRLFVLDEADKLLEGDFQESINWIYSTLPENKQILALSATYPEYLAQHLTAYMRNPTFVRLNITDPALLGIKQYHYVVPNHPMPNIVFDSKTEVIVKILSTVTFQQCLIFSNMQTKAINLQSELQSRNWPTACIAGCLDQKERNFAMEQLKSYKCRILISTDLTSRGIDADKVNLVINLDVPFDHETYLHRIGRAGRFGSYGAAVTIVSAGGQDKELWAVEKKCKTQIPKLPDPIPKDLVTKEISVSIEDIVSTEKILNQPEVETDSSSLVTSSPLTPDLPLRLDASSNNVNDLIQQTANNKDTESLSSTPDLFPKTDSLLGNANCISQQIATEKEAEFIISSPSALCHSIMLDNSFDNNNHVTPQNSAIVDTELVSSNLLPSSFLLKSDKSLDEADHMTHQTTELGEAELALGETALSVEEEPSIKTNGLRVVKNSESESLPITCETDFNDIQVEICEAEINKMLADDIGYNCLHVNGTDSRNISQPQQTEKLTEDSIKDSVVSGDVENEFLQFNIPINEDSNLMSDIVDRGGIQPSAPNSYSEREPEDVQSRNKDVDEKVHSGTSESITIKDYKNSFQDPEMLRDTADQYNISGENQVDVLKSSGVPKTMFKSSEDMQFVNIDNESKAVCEVPESITDNDYKEDSEMLRDSAKQFNNLAGNQDGVLSSSEDVAKTMYRSSENADDRTSKLPQIRGSSENISLYANNVSQEILNEAVTARMKLHNIKCKTLQIIGTKCSPGEEIRQTDLASVGDLVKKRMEKDARLNADSNNDLTNKSGNDQMDKQFCVKKLVDPGTEPGSCSNSESRVSVASSFASKESSSFHTEINSVAVSQKPELVEEEKNHIDKVYISEKALEDGSSQTLSKVLNSKATNGTVGSPGVQSRVLAKARRRAPRSFAVSDFLHCFNENSDPANSVGEDNVSIDVENKIQMEHFDTSLGPAAHRQTNEKDATELTEGNCENNCVSIETDGSSFNSSLSTDNQMDKMADKNKHDMKGNVANQQLPSNIVLFTDKPKHASGDENTIGRSDESENTNSENTVADYSKAKGPSEDVDRSNAKLCSDSPNSKHSVDDQCPIGCELLSKLDKELLARTLSGPLFKRYNSTKSAKFDDMVKDYEEFCANFDSETSKLDIPSVPDFTGYTDELNGLNSKIVKDLYELGVSSVKEMKSKFLEQIEAGKNKKEAQPYGDLDLESKHDSDGSRKALQRTKQPSHKGRDKVVNNFKSNSDDSNSESHKWNNKRQHRNETGAKDREKTQWSFEDELQQYQKDRGIGAKMKSRKGQRVKDPQQSDSSSWRYRGSSDDSSSDKVSKMPSMHSGQTSQGKPQKKQGKSIVTKDKSEREYNSAKSSPVGKDKSKNQKPKAEELSKRDVELIHKKEQYRKDKNAQECLQLDEMHSSMLKKRQAKKAEQLKNVNKVEERSGKDFSASRTNPADSSAVIEKHKENQNIQSDSVKGDREGKQLDDMHSDMMARRKERMKDNQSKEVKPEICPNDSFDEKIKDRNKSKVSEQGSNNLNCQPIANIPSIDSIVLGQSKENNLSEINQMPLSLKSSTTFNELIDHEDQTDKVREIKSKDILKSVENSLKPVKPSKSKARLAGLEVSDGSTSSSSDLSFSSTSAISPLNSSDVENKNMVSKSHWYANRYADEDEPDLKANFSQRKESRAKAQKIYKNSKSYRHRNEISGDSAAEGKSNDYKIDELNFHHPSVSLSPYAYQHPYPYSNIGYGGYSTSIQYLPEHSCPKDLATVIKKPKSRNETQGSRATTLSQPSTFYDSSCCKNIHHNISPHNSFTSTNSFSHPGRINTKQQGHQPSPKRKTKSKESLTNLKKQEKLKANKKEKPQKETVPDLSEESSGSESDEDCSSPYTSDYRTSLFQAQAHQHQLCFHYPSDHPYFQYSSGGPCPSSSYLHYWSQTQHPQYCHPSPFWNSHQCQPSALPYSCAVPPASFPQYPLYYHRGWNPFPSPSQQYIPSSHVYPHQVSAQQSSILQSTYISHMSKELKRLSKKYSREE